MIEVPIFRRPIDPWRPENRQAALGQRARRTSRYRWATGPFSGCLKSWSSKYTYITAIES